MSERSPRIRHYAPGPDGEFLVIREVVRIAFYMPHDHHDLATGANGALDAYLRSVGVGPDTLCYGEDEESFPLNQEGWDSIRTALRPNTAYRFFDEVEKDTEYFRRRTKKGYQTWVSLTGGASGPSGYEFVYRARLPWRSPPQGSVSTLHVTLPTEYLEAHGPGRVRELALELASLLPFATGHAGLAFKFFRPRGSHMHRVREEIFRHPGFDVPGAGRDDSMGTRVDGVHWLNFLGQPVLEELGGLAGLRARLHSPETTVQEMDGERVAVTLGSWPEAGDLAQGRDLPAYRELARVLEPWLDKFLSPYAYSWRGYTEDEVLRWWRRFLD
jgi:hypothetical protein